MSSYWFYKGLGSAFIGLAIIMGAFAAHALKSNLTGTELETWKTANYYLAIHGLGILIVSFLPRSPKIDLTLKLLSVGTILFAMSLMLLIATNISMFGMITPIGGICLIVGWFNLTWHCLKQEQVNKT